MKKKIHPNYQPTIFKDMSCNFAFLGYSSAKSIETMEWSDGKEYPVIKVEVSSASHPFYTGNDKILDTEGRVEKFRKKFKLNLE